MTTNEIINNWIKITHPRSTDLIKIGEVETIPVKIDDFLLWLVKDEVEMEFVFNENDYQIHISNDHGTSREDRKLKFELKIISRTLEASNRGRGYKHTETFRHRDNASFIKSIKDLKFKMYFIKYGEERIRVYNELKTHFDEKQKEKYIKGSVPSNILTNFEESKSRLLKEFETIGNTIFDLGHGVKVSTENHLPDKYKEKYYGYAVDIKVFISMGKLTEEDRAKVLLNTSLKKKQIKQMLESYLDLGIYVINIIKIDLKYEIDEQNSRVIIHIHPEILSLEDYYDTIGRFKSLLKSFCSQGTFKDEIKEMAKDLSIDITDMDNEQICKVLKEAVLDLKWDDFEH